MAVRTSAPGIAKRWRLKIRLRVSRFRLSRHTALRTLRPGESAELRVTGDGIPDRLTFALRQAWQATGSSPADPPRRASSVHRIGARGVCSLRLQPNLAIEPERPAVFLAIPAPRLAAGFGVRTVPAVPTRTLRLGPACACCPDLRRRYLSKTAAACPGPPRAFPAGSPSRGAHAGRAKTPPESCRPSINCEPVFSRFPSGPSGPPVPRRTGHSDSKTFGRILDPPSRSLGTRVCFKSPALPGQEVYLPQYQRLTALCTFSATTIFPVSRKAAKGSAVTPAQRLKPALRQAFRRLHHACANAVQTEATRNVAAARAAESVNMGNSRPAESLRE